MLRITTMLPGTATLPACRIPIQSVGSALAWRHFVMRALTCLNARLLVQAQHVILRAQRFAFPRPRIQVQDRPGLLGEPRVPRKNPVLVLPGLDRRFVQHPPNRAAADLLTQRRSGSPHQVGQRLATERFFRLRHHLTSHRLDQRLIQRGKKRPFGRGQDDLRRRNRRWPNDFANVALVERTDRPPRRFPGTVAHEEAAQAGSVGRFGTATVRRPTVSRAVSFCSSYNRCFWLWSSMVVDAP